MMREAVSFAGGTIAGEREDCALSDEVRGRFVLVQFGEDRSERGARMQFLRGCRIFRIHVHHEVRVGGEERHLAFSIATVGAMCIGLDKFPDSEPICRLFGRDSNVPGHQLVSALDSLAPSKSGLTNGP
jgi:hypothetical protein